MNEIRRQNHLNCRKHLEKFVAVNYIVLWGNDHVIVKNSGENMNEVLRQNHLNCRKTSQKKSRKISRIDGHSDS